MKYSILQGTPHYTRWSEGAKRCYERNCVCLNCPTYTILGDKCRMKYAVVSLIKETGLPQNVQEKQIEIIESEEILMFDNDLQIEYPNFLEKLIMAVKKGYESYADLEKETEQNRQLLSVYFGSIYKLLEQKKLIKKSEKTQKQQVIDFIQSRLLDTEYKEIEKNTPAPVIVEVEQPLSELEGLKTENQKLKERIKELETRTQNNIDFSELKTKIKSEIERLNKLLEVVESYDGDLLTLISEIGNLKK